ncbi:DUF924 family protein [Candidatus Viadribacter manganicus]|uniref:DUF924 domain-containing protein n=1 Tax=Candidatus Viadribacter manganicus TaxID=1759059 RepID=A0A1B1AL22_9PROT|nr:DUF924 family protein [Candidatus Viadribacter manganicus]ANP47272.1 hypothetical protein ATE48_15775 [Candidatus Viadribacter manganicus]
MATASEIVRFWRDAGPKFWFVKDETFDGRCRGFEAEHHAAARGELSAWERDAEGALALLILLDQIPRNIFRKSPHAFATDGLAQAMATRALERGFDAATDSAMRIFFYLPFEHAEDLAQQEHCVTLFTNLGDAEYLKFAILHRDVIARFGRFPHRNAVLGRKSTVEELQFLADGGFSG